MENWKDFNETENVTINPSNIDEVYGDFRQTKNVTINTDRDIVNYFENEPKRYKIKQKKAFEQEIDEERKRVTINTVITGGTILATTLCALSVLNNELDFVQRCAYLLLSTVTSKGLYDSAKTLNEAVKRKLKLERTYFDTYNEEYEEKRGRSL